LALLDSEEATAKKFATAGETTLIAFALLRQHGHLKAVDLLSRYEGRLRRLHERARRDLERLQASKMPVPVKLPPQKRETEALEASAITVPSTSSKQASTSESVYTVEPKSEPIQPDFNTVRSESDPNEEPKLPLAA
jgi:hypothetical protein